MGSKGMKEGDTATSRRMAQQEQGWGRDRHEGRQEWGTQGARLAPRGLGGLSRMLHSWGEDGE